MASHSCSTTWNPTTIGRPIKADGLIGLRRRNVQENGLCKTSQRTSNSNWYPPPLSELSGETEKANEQHYEVTANFFRTCLGPKLKYSCCYYPTGHETLEQAEIAMLESYVDKAQVEDGMKILDLGCGWGSLGLFLAEVCARRWRGC
jgi:cyclopropane fatty-acyl-phospholipid synthase-like methyltransferase